MDNLKAVKNHLLGFKFAVKSNRRVFTKKGTWVQVQKLDIPEDEKLVLLLDFGNVKRFERPTSPHYVVFLPEVETSDPFKQVKQVKQAVFQNCMLKQVCNIEKFQVSGKVPIINHLFVALCNYIQLHKAAIY